MPRPTLQDYRAYNGAHCHVLWSKLSDTWQCPGCDRTKFQIMRWTQRFTDHTKKHAYMGWMAGLHTHHDHDAINKLRSQPRFKATIICDQCNAIDAQVKRRYRDIDTDFSFSPIEIRKIIISTPHRSHIVKYQLAREIWFSIISD